MILMILLLVSLSALPAAADDDGVLHDARRLVGDVVSDIVHVYTAPARTTDRQALGTAAVFGLTALSYAHDERIHGWLDDHRDGALVGPVRETGEFLEPAAFLGKTNKYYFGAVGLGWLSGWDALATAGIQALECHLITGVTKSAVQSLVGRQRPYGNLGADAFGVENATSFPSGHTLTAWQVAAILSHHGDRRAVSWAAYGGAFAVSVQRVTGDMHWPSDVVLSGVYGWLVAKSVVTRWDERARERSTEGDDPAWTLTPAPVDGRLGLVIGAGF